MGNVVVTVIGLFQILAGLAGTVGAVLLIFAGEWSLLFSLLFAIVVAPFAIGIAVMPSMIFAIPGVALGEKGHKFLSNLLVWLSTLYLGVVFAVWSVYVFIYVMNESGTFWGGVFASFGTAISPIAYMASKGPVQDDFASFNQTLTMLTAQISLVVMISMGALNGGTIYELGTFYMAAFTVLSIIQLTITNLLLDAGG